MYFFYYSYKQIGTVLPLLLVLPSTVFTACSDGDDGDAISEGPTTDMSAGIGMEYEAANLVFKSGKCSYKDTTRLKGKTIIGRQDVATPPLWSLTPDTTENLAGTLNGEYILSGVHIKLGAGKIGPVAAEVAQDLINWNPSAQMRNPVVNVEDSNCNPWQIVAPKYSGSAANLYFAAQATAPLPLEAIHDLIHKVKNQGLSSSLLTSQRFIDSIIDVTNVFFTSNPEGNMKNTVTDDILGFFSLILSYAKSTSSNSASQNTQQSPKTLCAIMPRTDFTSIYNLIRKSVKGDLYKLVKILACYKQDQDKTIIIDTLYCSGTLEAPVVGSKMDGQRFEYKGETLTVKEWIDSISAGTNPDALTTFDKKADESIGGFGTAMEYVLGTERAVPLFEFRSLGSVIPQKFQDIASAVESELVEYHNAYPNAPSRSTNRKRGNTTACASGKPPEPTFAVFLSNNTISAGEANDWNNGSWLQTQVYTKLRKFCPNGSAACDSTQSANIDTFGDIIGHRLTTENLTFTITDSHYDTSRDRDRLLSAALATWQAAVSVNCKNMTYVMDQSRIDGPDCGTPTGKRSHLTGPKIKTDYRSLSKKDVLPPPTAECTNYNMTQICKGPDHVTAIKSNASSPYGQHMDIQVQMKLDDDSPLADLLCDLIIASITYIAQRWAPRIAGSGVWGKVDFEAVCATTLDGFGSGY